MLILTLVTTMILIMMTRHRVWVYSALTGAVMAIALWRLMYFFERVLPSAWHTFNGVLAFLVVAAVVMMLMPFYEKSVHEQDDIEN